MRIDVDRLCRLAGVPAGKSTKRLSEASNRSQHEDPALKNDTKIQYGNQLNEMDHADEGHYMEEDGHAMEGDYMEEDGHAMEEDYMEEGMARVTFLANYNL